MAVDGGGNKVLFFRWRVCSCDSKGEDDDGYGTNDNGDGDGGDQGDEKGEIGFLFFSLPFPVLYFC